MIKKIVKYFQEVLVEAKKITWPTRKEVKNHTIVVIASIGVSMIVFGLIDMGFTKILEYFIYKG